MFELLKRWNMVVLSVAAVLFVYLIIGIIIFAATNVSAAEQDGPGTAAPLNPAYIEYTQGQRAAMGAGGSGMTNYGYEPSTVDLSHIEKLRASRN